MKFRFNEEQQMIRDTAERFFSRYSDSAAVREAMATEAGYDPELWQQLCQELALHTITLPESCGGMGLGYVELAAVMEQMGRFLVCAPYFSSICLALPALSAAQNVEQARPWMLQLAEGKTAALAWAGRDARDCDAVTAHYDKTDTGYTLNGTYCWVIDGHSADFLILVARTKTGQGDSRIQFFVTDASHQAIHRQWTPAMDQTRQLAQIEISNLELPHQACLTGLDATTLHHLLNLAAVAQAAELAGVAGRTLEMARDYTLERHQFGRPIAAFQAIKHKAADMMLRCEAARSACYYAACIADEALQQCPLGSELPQAAAIALSCCTESALQNAAENLQLHGGVGFTWEYDVHLYLKRAKSAELMFGSPSEQREYLASLLLDQGASEPTPMSPHQLPDPHLLTEPCLVMQTTEGATG